MSTTAAHPARTGTRSHGVALEARCVGAAPQRGALARLEEHGVRFGTGGGTPQLVFATVPQDGIERAALHAALRTGLPLVLDLASPWALDGRSVYATPLHLARERRAMRRALTSAAFVLVRTPDMIAACAEFGLPRERAIVVPDGCDPDGRMAANPGATFDIWVAPTLAPADHPPCATRDGLLQRRPRQIEPVGATGFYLFSALAALRQKRPDLFARVRVHFSAPLDETNLDIVAWLELEDALQPGHGRPASADAVFVCQHGEDGAARAIDVPDSLWPALATGRPLLAALPPGVGRDLVLALGAGAKMPATDAPPLCLAIERLMDGKANGVMPAGVSAELLARLDERGIAAIVADALRAVASKTALPAAAQSLWPMLGATGRVAE